MEKYKFLEHTADVKFQAFGKSIEEAFKNSALATKQSILNDENLINKVKTKIKKQISVQGKDNESLLYNFLEEFLFLLDSEDFLLSKVSSIKLNNFKLKATVLGDKAKNYKFTNNIKAVTYNEMFVKPEIKGKNKIWVCQVVLDA